MNSESSFDRLTKPAFLLVAGRTLGFVAAFAIPIVLARIFTQTEFGTYKQLFLIFSTLFGLAQLGMAESLYYFIPRRSEESGRQIVNALVTLTGAGLFCVALLWATRDWTAAWMANPALAASMPALGWFLALMLVSAVLEIAMVARKRHLTAALTYAASDVVRTALFVLPAFAFASLQSVMLGAVAFAALRVGVTVLYLWREFRGELRIDALVWRRQLAYALPFALAVGIEVIQVNFHQYVVATSFDAATFAIYAVGCLQIPLVDLIMTSTTNVMMVRMAEDMREGQMDRALALWHDTICRLAFLIFPLAVLLLVAARDVIVVLFTTRYLASVPIFMLWSLTILPAAFAVDAVLRVYAQTRFLLVMNIVRLAIVAGLIGVFMSAFGMNGAVLVTLVATVAVKIFGIARIARLMDARLADTLPWQGLIRVTASALLAAVPVIWVQQAVTGRPVVRLVAATLVYGITYLTLYLAGTRMREVANRVLSPAADAPARQVSNSPISGI